MFKKAILFAIPFFAGISGALAINISVTGTVTAVTNGGSTYHGAVGSQVSILNTAGNPLPAGSQIRLGFFLNYSPALDASLRAGNFQALFTGSNRFVPFGESTSAAGYGDNTEATNDIKEIPAGSGSLRASVTYTGLNYSGADGDVSGANTLTSGGVARGTKVFMFVYNSSSLSTDATGFEYGLYSATNWLIPSTGTATASIQLQHVDSNAEVFWGSLGSLKTAAPIPEPSVTLLAIGSLASVFRRRRR
jgi:hypothetical protein